MPLFDLLTPFVEQLYEGRCDIIETRNQTGLLNDGIETMVYQNIPCRLDFDRNAAASPGEAATEATQTITLLLTPEIIVKEGSKAVVTQQGRTTVFYCSGVPAVYASHQEITLTTEDRWC